jgi:ABC-2 type transport system ATP-binding protein
VTAAPLAELSASAQPSVVVRTPDTASLGAALAAAGIPVSDNGPDRIVALGATPEAVGRAIAAAGVVVYEMSLVGGSLEDAFLRLTTPEEITR